MKRRNALATIASCLLWPAMAPAQPSKRIPVVGMLITHPPVTDPVVEAVRTGLRQHGYEDGNNIKLEVRSALGQLDRVPALAQELVQLKVDVIVVANDPALRAVLKATSTIPIVMTGYTDDPTAMGWIESYRRPGKNVTGAFTVNAALIAKRLALVKEMLPAISRCRFWRWSRWRGRSTSCGPCSRNCGGPSPTARSTSAPSRCRRGSSSTRRRPSSISRSA